MITFLKEPLWKHCGSRQHLGVKDDTKGKAAMFTVAHLPQTNIIQRRRRSMCEQINTTIQQLVEERIAPYYPPLFPHGLDYMSGGYIYSDVVPKWWYRLAHQSPPVILQFPTERAMFPLEVEMVLLAHISAPANYTQCSRAQYSIASQHWWVIVDQLHDQYFVPARQLTWWGWHLTTRGPPVVYRPAHVFDPDEEVESRRSIIDAMTEEFEVDSTELMNLDMPNEVTVMRNLGYESDEWVFWRAAQLALAAGMRDSEELGWPPPIGIRGSPAGFRLIYDEEDGLSNTTLSYGDESEG